MRAVLIEASPWNPETGDVVPIALAGGGSRAYRHRGRNDWIAGVTTEPRFSARINFDQDGFAGGAVPENATLAFMPGTAAALELVAGLLWNGAAIEVRVGDDALVAPVWELLVKGVVEAPKVENGVLTLVIRDLTGSLDKPVTPDRFTGAGGLEGAATAAERVKRRSWGELENVEARLLNAATNVYELGDPAFPLEDIVDVKDMGRSASALTLVPWQGSAAATLALLELTAAPQGGAAIAPSIACLKWWTMNPPGPITADIAATAEVTAAEIAGELVEDVSDLVVANVADAALWRPGHAGLHVEDPSETAAKALDRLLRGSSLAWSADSAGDIYIRELTLAIDAVETVIVTKVARARAFKPVTRRRVGFKRNHRIHNDSEISAALTNGDGLVLDDYWPDEPGATRNAPAQLLQDVVFSPAWWSLGPVSGAVAYADAPAGYALLVQPRWVGDNFVEYGGPSRHYFHVQPAKRVFLRLEARPTPAGELVEVVDDGDGVVDDGDTVVTTLGEPADWPLELEVVWYDATRTAISTTPIGSLAPGGGQQFVNTSALPPAGSRLGSLRIGHSDFDPGDEGLGGWLAWSPWVSEHQPAADVTAENAPALEVSPIAVTVAAASDGTVDPWVPKFISPVRKRGDLNVTLATEWGATFSGVTGTIDNDPMSANRGRVELTGMAGLSGKVTITSDFDGVPLAVEVPVTKSLSGLPSGGSGGGGGGGSATTHDWDVAATVNNGSYTTSSAEATIAVGASGTLDATTFLEYHAPFDVGFPSDAVVAGKWQHSPAGAGTWTDFGAEVVGTLAEVDAHPFGYWTRDDPGYLECNQGATGLAAGSYDVRLMLRVYSGSFTAVYPYGPAHLEGGA